MAIAIGIVRHQPLAKQIAHFQRKPQEDVARLPGAGVRGRIENSLELGVDEGRNERGDKRECRDAGVGKRSDRMQTLGRR